VILVITKQVEDFADMINMLFSSFAEMEDVMNVHFQKCVEERPQHVVHGSLRGGRSIGETKAENIELVVPKGCAVRCFFLMFRRGADLIVPRLQIKAGENFAPAKESMAHPFKAADSCS